MPAYLKRSHFSMSSCFNPPALDGNGGGKSLNNAIRVAMPSSQSEVESAGTRSAGAPWRTLVLTWLVRRTVALLVDAMRLSAVRSADCITGAADFVAVDDGAFWYPLAIVDCRRLEIPSMTISEVFCGGKFGFEGWMRAKRCAMDEIW
jgi:hypothetical protein